MDPSYVLLHPFYIRWSLIYPYTRVNKHNSLLSAYWLLPHVSFQVCTWINTVWLVIFMRYLFSRFSQVKSRLRKLKPRKFCRPCTCKANEPIFNPRPTWNYLYSLQHNRVSEFPLIWRLLLKLSWKSKCYISTDAQTTQHHKADIGSNRYYECPVYSAFSCVLANADSPTAKIKTMKISENRILASFANTCTSENLYPRKWPTIW